MAKAADAANLLHYENNIKVADQNKDGADTNAFYPNTAFIGGISGGLLSSCLSNGIACKAFLVFATSGIPDPEGARNSSRITW